MNKSLLCSEENCKHQINHSKLNQIQCNICNIPLCSEICLVNHITSHHNNKNSNSSLVSNGKILPQASLHQTNPAFNIENFEKVITKGKETVLGNGAFGSVYLVRHKKTGKLYGMKQMHKITLKNLLDDSVIRREAYIHIMLSHENICKLYAYREDNDYFYMIMEYESNGNLFTEIQKSKKGGLSEEKAYEYFIQVCSAIHFLHSNGIIHRDIKPENSLLDANNKIKICDFGWTTKVAQPRTTFCGTFEYMAPEIIQEHPYTKSVDIWSLGILLYEILHGFSPFKAQNCFNGESANTIMKNILKNQYVFKRQDLSSEVKDLISQLLNSNEKTRITIEEVLNHPWIKNHSLIKEKEKEDNDLTMLSTTLIQNEVLFDSVFSKLTKKSQKVMSPIDKKGDLGVSFSLYKEIHELEKEIDAKTNALNSQFKKAEERNRTKKTLSSRELTSPSIQTYNDNVIPRKAKNKIVKKLRRPSPEMISYCSEMSTQTDDISTERKSWNIFSIFKCGN